MDLIAIVLFLVSYYLRPQEWNPLFGSIKFAQLIMIFAVLALFFRERSLRLGDLVRTPHDWAMLVFWGWIVTASPTPWETFKNTYSLPVTYFIIVQVLTTIPRIKKFVGWWTFLILAIAALALLSEYGFDPLGSYDLTHGRMQGRLTLNLSLFRNPNALGHNVVPALAMLYFYCIWRRPLFIKEVGLVLMTLPLYSIYLTLSKGAFITGALASLATLTFGRPKGVQAVIIGAALMFGGTLVWALPRMQELKETKTDEAIRGRVAAFEHGLKTINEVPFGIGHGRWLEDFRRARGYNKAAHSSYVQLGAELGKVGFFLFLAILYCNLRTLITARTRDDDEERIRRILFVLVISYMISSWMIDFGYRPTFFMFTAAIAAFHRLLNHVSDEDPAPAGSPTLALPAWRARLIAQPAAEAAFAKAGTSTAVLTLEAEPAPSAPAESAPERRIGRGWNALGWVDLALILVFTASALRFWQFIMTRM